MTIGNATLSYQSYCAREWIFWLGLKNTDNVSVVARSFKVGEFTDPKLVGEFYIKNGEVMLTRTKAGEEPLQRLVEETEKIAKAGNYRFVNHVERNWKDIYEDKNATPRPFA